MWIPAPRYALRRACVLRHLDTYAPDLTTRIIEMGCGGGALLRELSNRGYPCTGIETSDAAQRVANAMQSGPSTPADILESSPPDRGQPEYDCLLSCEVLEHIEDDHGALRDWLTLLKPGGLVVLAVPAHQKRFGPLDVWAGHHRRYEQDEFVSLLETNHVQLRELQTYGFPLANLTSWVRNRRLKREHANADPSQRAALSARSGIERDGEMRIFEFQRSWSGRLLMRCALLAQRLFARTLLGDGFIAVGVYPPWLASAADGGGQSNSSPYPVGARFVLMVSTSRRSAHDPRSRYDLSHR